MVISTLTAFAFGFQLRGSRETEFLLPRWGEWGIGEWVDLLCWRQR